MSYPDNPSSWPDPSPPPPEQAPQYPVSQHPAQAPQYPAQSPAPPPGAAPAYPGAGPPGYGYGYGGYPPGYQPGYPMQAKTNGMAVAAMVISIVSAVSLLCVLCFAPLGLVALGGGVTGTIMGFIARRQVRERGERGEGMAMAGAIIGLVTAALGVIAVLVVVALIGWSAQTGSF